MRQTTRRFLAPVMLGLVVLAVAAPARAQVLVEATGGVGFTAVNLDEWSSAARAALDWNQTNTQFRALVLPFTSGRLSLGGEFAKQSLFWYSWNGCPRCVAPLPYTSWVESTSVIGAGRLSLGRRKFVDFGAGVFLMAGDTYLGASSAVGYEIPVNARISVPIKFRTDVVFSEMVVVPAVSVGIALRL